MPETAIGAAQGRPPSPTAGAATTYNPEKAVSFLHTLIPNGRRLRPVLTGEPQIVMKVSSFARTNPATSADTAMPA
jgi:hypothetical protein